jgi:hypothetical protein
MVNPAHNYAISVYGWTHTFSDDYANQSFTATFEAVPEPQSFALLVLGGLAMAHTRWRKLL